MIAEKETVEVERHRSRKVEKQEGRKAESPKTESDQKPEMNGPPYVTGVTPRTSTTNQPAMRPRVASTLPHGMHVLDPGMGLRRFVDSTLNFHIGFHLAIHQGTWSGPCGAAERSFGWPFLQDLDRTTAKPIHSHEVSCSQHISASRDYAK